MDDLRGGYIVNLTNIKTLNWGGVQLEKLLFDGETVWSRPAIIITRQPVDVTVAVNETIIFSVEAEGEGLTYQWEYTTNGGTSWGNNTMNGNQTNTLSWAARDYQNGYMYRCLITDANGHTLRTKEVTLTVS